MDHEIRCPSCEQQFRIWTFSIGMSDLVQFQCSNCPTVLAIEPSYAHVTHNRYAGFRCECGGEFRMDAPFHCPHCNAAFSMDQLKAQINWWGTPDGKPGVCITKCIDEKHREWGLPSKHAG